MKQIYFLLFLFSILSLAYCHKTTLHHFKYETKCPQDPFDVKFFYKIPNNSSLKSSHQNLDDSTTNLPPPLETPPPESQPQPQETFTRKVFGGIGNFFKKIPSTVSHHAQQVGEKAKEFSHKAFDNAKEAGSKTVSFISSNIASGVNNIKGKAKDVTESIEKKAHHGWEVIKETSKSVENAAESIGEKAKETSKSFGEKVVNVSKKIVDSVKDIGSKAKESIISGVKGTVNHLKEDTEKVSDTVKEGLKKVPEVIVNAANSVGEKGKDVFNKIKDPASNLGGKIKNTVSKGVCTLLDGLKSIPRKASEGVSSARNLIPNEVPQSLKNLKTTVKDFFTSLPQKGSVIKEKFQKVKSFIGEKIEDIVKFVGGKKDRIISKAKEGAFTVKNVVWDGTGWLFSSLWDKLYKVIIGVGLILGLYIFIQIRPFLLFLLDVLSLFKCKRSKGNEPASKVSKPQPTSTVNNEEREMRSPGVRKNQAVKLAKEEFEVNCVSLKANKITNNDTLCFLRYHLHYEISHFPTLEGEVLLKLTTKAGNDVKCSDIFKIPAEEFVCRSIWDGCSFQNCVDKYIEDVNVRLCVDFKGHNGQYFSIYSRDFEIVF